MMSTERILILGCTPLSEQLIHEIERRPSRRRVIVGVLDDRRLIGGGPAEVARLQRIIEKLSPTRLVFALSERRGRTPFGTLLESCIARGVIVEDVVEYYERIAGKLAFESLAPMAVILSGGFRPPRFYQAVSRGVSLLVALLALIPCAPLMAIVALAIKLDSKGPVFFRQQRAGSGGKPFTLVKFRTMQHGGTRRSEWEGDNRDAVTRVGKFLRAFRIDDVPQFINIIRGDMNLIGPRPHPVSNLELLTLVARNLNELTGAAISCYMLRALVRPGLTGWAQVRYRYANNLEEELEKLRYDLYYVKHLSLWLDLRIALETIKVLRGQKVLDLPPQQAAAHPVRAARSPLRSLDVARLLLVAVLPLWMLGGLADAASAAQQRPLSQSTPPQSQQVSTPPSQPAAPVTQSAPAPQPTTTQQTAAPSAPPSSQTAAPAQSPAASAPSTSAAPSPPPAVVPQQAQAPTAPPPQTQPQSRGGSRQQPPPQAATTRAAVVDPTRPDYVIGPDDELEISVWENAALTRTVPVRPDGKISLPLINDVQAAGLTPMQLQGALAKALTSFVQAPEVSVIVRAVHSFKVSVVGEVREPGRFELTGRPTVLDMIALAKGLTEYADKRRIVVLRRERGQNRQIPFAYDKLLSDNAEGLENFFVQSDDIVLVR
jgi:lipopolysaccharide/colanic/teichoic acid biosynthesis glycosyltransferase/protein involved in polysaccharide export with SLBB domain